MMYSEVLTAHAHISRILHVHLPKSTRASAAVLPGGQVNFTRPAHKCPACLRLTISYARRLVASG